MSEVIDMNIYNEAREMMKDKFPTLVGYFLEDAAEYISAIKSGVAGENVQHILTASHTLKSSARQIGAAKLSLYAAQIEESLRGGNGINSVVHMLPKIDTAFTETSNVLSVM
jgi:HPt (histidine-containing phosphotransfer) domain-containing protein